MKITERKLLDGYVGISNGLDIMSEVNGEMIWWQYRRDSRSQTDGYEPTCDSDVADCIRLANNRSAKLELDDSHESHPSVARINTDMAKICGGETKRGEP